MKFDAVLRTWKEFFEAEGIRYALGGGLAVHAWGRSRTTYDIDFIVDGAERARALAFAESLGYRAFHISEGYSNHDHPSEDFGRIDLIYIYGATADAIFSAAEPKASFGDVTVPVATAQHLIAMKLAAVKNAPRRMPIDMPNATPSPDLDFDRDLPTTAADVEALDRARNLRKLPDEVYLEWLELLSRNAPPRERDDAFPSEPFVLD